QQAEVVADEFADHALLVLVDAHLGVDPGLGCNPLQQFLHACRGLGHRCLHRLPPASGPFLLLARGPRGRRDPAAAGSARPGADGLFALLLLVLLGRLGTATAKQGADAPGSVRRSGVAVGTTSAAAATSTVVATGAGGGRHGGPYRPLDEVLLAHR